MKRTIDLNADVGEGSPGEPELMTLVSSANVCCGAHAGDADTIKWALQWAKEYDLSVGAHPGYPDRANFGRRPMQLSPQEIIEECVQQIDQLREYGHKFDLQIGYVKPHGALYHQVCHEDEYAGAFLEFARSAGLPILGFAGSTLHQMAVNAGDGGFIAEGFADRRYDTDGRLVSRTEAGAMISDPDVAARQVELLMTDRQVESICVHGDTPGAVNLVRAIRNRLAEAEITVRPFASRRQ